MSDFWDFMNAPFRISIDEKEEKPKKLKLINGEIINADYKIIENKTKLLK